MVDFAEMKSVKRDFGDRILRAGLLHGPSGFATANTVKAAIANSGANAHAVSIGYKIVDGKETDTLAIRIHVTQKLAASIIPKQSLFPKDINGHPTDIIASPPAFVMPAAPDASASGTNGFPPNSDPNRMSVQRPVRAEISAAQYVVTAGTIACFCRSTADGDDPDVTYALSNNHVFANVNRAKPGDAIYQQSPMDGGSADDTIGGLTRFVKLELDGHTANIVDCAIAALHDGVSVNPEITVIGPLCGTAEPELNMLVRKHGRTSGYTEGKITDVHYDAIVGMDHSNPNSRAAFHDQVRIERIAPFDNFAISGDSGSLVVGKDRAHAVGLYFAGPQSGVYGVANDIGSVLSELEIALVLGSA